MVETVTLGMSADIRKHLLHSVTVQKSHLFTERPVQRYSHVTNRTLVSDSKATADFRGTESDPVLKDWTEVSSDFNQTE